MAGNKTRFVCQNCGADFPKWSGQCSQCGQWNTLVETLVSTKNSKSFNHSISVEPVSLKKIGQKKFSRIPTGITELDRVLGSGLVSGSISLLAGEPGIGKSTLLTQLCLTLLAAQKPLKSILYICGEESPEQIKIRINRMIKKLPVKISKNFLFLPETDADIINQVIQNTQPGLIIVDSVQTLKTDDLSGMAGSVGQVRECSYRLQQTVKKLHLPLILVGHVTKGGEIAGPKVLEHLVDVVLQLEGDKKHNFRILRSQKNRFGPVDEIGIFQMEEQGMTEVKNPSDIFLEERLTGIPGSVVTATMEGTRPVLVEIQALVIPTTLAIPRRISNGFDQRRLQMISAVLTRRCGLKLADCDIYVNIAGGLRVDEPAVDLGVCLAIASSYKNKPLPKKSVVFGEIGLLGEIRKVTGLQKRIKEAQKLGYTKIFSPQNNNQLSNLIKKLF